MLGGNVNYDADGTMVPSQFRLEESVSFAGGVCIVGVTGHCLWPPWENVYPNRGFNLFFTKHSLCASLGQAKVFSGLFTRSFKT